MAVVWGCMLAWVGHKMAWFIYAVSNGNGGLINMITFV